MLLDDWDDPQTWSQTALLAGNGTEPAACSLTVDLRARPLGSGVFVGGADGVSDCRERLQQRERSRKRSSDKDTRQVARVFHSRTWTLLLGTIRTLNSNKVPKQN